MSDTTVKVGQIYRSNDKRDWLGRFVKVVGFPPGDGRYAQILRVSKNFDEQWAEHSTSRVTTIKISSLGVTRQTGYSLEQDV
jgi:hypothetical protein